LFHDEKRHRVAAGQRAGALPASPRGLLSDVVDELGRGVKLAGGTVDVFPWEGVDRDAHRPQGARQAPGVYETHVPIWTARAADIGVSAELIAELAEATAAAREAFLAQRQAQAAARSATLRYNLAVGDVRRLGAGVTEVIRAKAQQRGGNAVYALASVAPPRKPSPIAPPGKPYAFQIALAQVAR